METKPVKPSTTLADKTCKVFDLWLFSDDVVINNVNNLKFSSKPDFIRTASL